MKLSIIIPNYNNFKNLSRLLKNLTKQTVFEDAEIIVVDDGSTCHPELDSKFHGIPKQIRNDNKLKLYRIQHAGAPTARNFGFEKSSGEYIDIISSYTSRNIENISLVSGSRYEPLLLEIKSFLENIANKEKPIVDGEKGYNALKCIIAALTSAKKQKPIEIS